MASPTSWLGTSAAPVARIASSTCWASCCNWSSSTGRPWQARRTPATTLARLNGSLTPLRLTTASTGSSTVVKRREHRVHERRRRVTCPSSASRESTTRESGCRQYGHFTARSHRPVLYSLRTHRGGDVTAAAIPTLPVGELHARKH